MKHNKGFWASVRETSVLYMDAEHLKTKKGKHRTVIVFINLILFYIWKIYIFVVQDASEPGQLERVYYPLIPPSKYFTRKFTTCIKCLMHASFAEIKSQQNSVSFKKQLIQLSLGKKGILNMKHMSWDACFFPWNVNSGNKYFFFLFLFMYIVKRHGAAGPLSEMKRFCPQPVHTNQPFLIQKA